MIFRTLVERVSPERARRAAPSAGGGSGCILLDVRDKFDIRSICMRNCFVQVWDLLWLWDKSFSSATSASQLFVLRGSTGGTFFGSVNKSFSSARQPFSSDRELVHALRSRLNTGKFVEHCVRCLA